MIKRQLVPLLFCLSGATSFIYELVWSRQLQVQFGTTIFISSSVLSIFLLGFTIGSLAFKTRSILTNRPLHLFGIMELMIGAYGILMIFIVKLIPYIYILINSSVAATMLFFAILLLLPTILYGGTWPVAIRCFNESGPDTAQPVAVLYSFNSLGSVFGVCLCGFVFIPLFGFTLASLIAAVVNIGVGLIFIRMAR